MQQPCNNCTSHQPSLHFLSNYSKLHDQSHRSIIVHFWISLAIQEAAYSGAISTTFNCNLTDGSFLACYQIESNSIRTILLLGSFPTLSLCLHWHVATVCRQKLRVEISSSNSSNNRENSSTSTNMRVMRAMKKPITGRMSWEHFFTMKISSPWILTEGRSISTDCLNSGLINYHLAHSAN